MKSHLKFFLTLSIIVFSFGLYAQITPPPAGNNIPLDGGILILLSAAAGYAANKMKKSEAK